MACRPVRGPRCEHPVQGIVGAGDRSPGGIGFGKHIAGGIEGAVGDAGIGAGLGGDVPQGVLRIGGGERARIGDLRDLVECVQRRAQPPGI